MKSAQKITAFVAGLIAVFVVAVWVGRTIGPQDVTIHRADGHGASTAAPESPGGLQSTQDGYTLEMANPILDAEKDVEVAFRILDATESPLRNYVENHEKLLHFIVVRNDLSAYQHLHPTLDRDGTWRVPVDLRRAGDYRMFADFKPADGSALTLGANVHVAGDYAPQRLPAEVNRTDVDGYTVTLSGTPTAGEPSMLTLTVSRGGKPVADLQPYLGAYGHLVALRASDLAYLHVHPAGEPGDGATAPGPEIEFHTTFPSAGAYCLFLDFQHRDVVRTAEFTVTVDGAARAPAAHTGHGH
jgi:hypothetical protein